MAGTAGAGSLSKGEGVVGKKGPSPSFDPSTQIGAMAPLGFFDPAGFAKKGDEDGFRTLRAAEIKHGRARDRSRTHFSFKRAVVAGGVLRIDS